MDIITLDFETWPIRQRPAYPPVPVGLAYDWPGRGRDYVSWGHVAGGNKADSDAFAHELLGAAWRSGLPLLFHNAKFDLAVCYEYFKMPELPWNRVHDTMFLAYLDNPHNPKIDLKSLAAAKLGMAPDERDAVAEWIWGHRADIEAHPKGGKVSKARPGEWIAFAPGDVVEPYGIGDVVRTAGLFAALMPEVARRGMSEAYDRERRLLPILMANERQGMRCDVARLENDTRIYREAFARVEDGLRRVLHAPGLNFDADEDVAAVLLSSGVVPTDQWTLTKSGRMSVAKMNLMPAQFTGKAGPVPGADIASALGYRNRLKTCLTMFMEPWLAQAQVNRGFITTNWNQTRGVGDGGARTGRPSTNNHNFLNVSKSFAGRDDGYVHPGFLGVPLLPLCRVYVLPDEGGTWVHRDFSQQEMRIFAEAERGDLYEKYRADPKTNPHEFVGVEFKRVAQRDIDSTKIKVLNFQGLYGGGVPALQKQLRCSIAEAKELKAFHDKALPGRKIVADELTRLARRNEPIRTLGGRLYFGEPPGPDGRSKAYKLLNYWVQGSAADLTKQALIEWDDANKALPRGQQARFLVTVYDEVNISAPRDLGMAHMDLLREMMDSPRLGMTVPMRSAGKVGPTWGELEKVA